jgi:hypothetical protein
MFANKLKRITKMYKDDLAIQTSIKNYKEFIQNIQKTLEKKKDQERIEAQKKNN